MPDQPRLDGRRDAPDERVRGEPAERAEADADGDDERVRARCSADGWTEEGGRG